MDKLSQAEKIEYLKREGCICPYCGASILDGPEEISITADGYRGITGCPSCRKVWYDLYEITIIGIKEINNE